MQTAEKENVRTSETERVYSWRVEQSRRAGYPARAASKLARHRDVDLHLAIELLDRGCRPALAIQILLWLFMDERQPGPAVVWPPTGAMAGAETPHADRGTGRAAGSAVGARASKTVRWTTT